MQLSFTACVTAAFFTPILFGVTIKYNCSETLSVILRAEIYIKISLF